MALDQLRKHLGAGILLSDRETAQINPDYPLWVDAREFAAIADLQPQISDRVSQSAADMYQGDLLADFYDDWILTEREHYRTLYLDALLHLTQQMRTRSEYERAIGLAERILASDPANERAYQHLMFCYVATGKRSVALKQYEECKRTLREELAVEPAPETTALYQWIKQAPPGSKSQAALITNLTIPLSSFIGRGTEMAEIKQRLATTRLMTLTGAGGSGKTRLAIQVATDLVDAYRDGVWWVELCRW